MATALAIAGVTAILADLLQNGMVVNKVGSLVGGDVKVSAFPPDRLAVDDQEPIQVNLFLYQVTYNSGWRNEGLPARNSQGERTANPPLALNLHYLLTAYGAKYLNWEILLGYAMQVLHDTPILSRDAIRTALAPSPIPAGFPADLKTCELADQVEQIKIIPEVMNLEETSKIWTAMGAHYRPTAAYQVTVVLIESKRSMKAALPVQDWTITAMPFHTPVIERLLVQKDPAEPASDDQPIQTGDVLVIRGSRLRGVVTKVAFEEHEAIPEPTQITDSEIRLPLPAVLRAGVHGVQIVHYLALPSPAAPVAHRAGVSNLAAFVLRPTLDEVTRQTVSTAPGGKKGKLKVVLDPPVGRQQRVMVILNEVSPPATRPARGYSFVAPAGNGVPEDQSENAEVVIDYAGVGAGSYLVRVQVDGAESPLTRGSNGNFSGPEVTI